MGLRSGEFAGPLALATMSVYFRSYLSGDGDLIMGFKPQRALAFVGVIEGNRHSGLGDASLTIFVNQVLKIGGAYLKNKREQHKALERFGVNYV